MSMNHQRTIIVASKDRSYENASLWIHDPRSPYTIDSGGQSDCHSITIDSRGMRLESSDNLLNSIPHVRKQSDAPFHDLEVDRTRDDNSPKYGLYPEVGREVRKIFNIGRLCRMLTSVMSAVRFLAYSFVGIWFMSKEKLPAKAGSQILLLANWHQHWPSVIVHLDTPGGKSD
jgi:hypothetical protein